MVWLWPGRRRTRMKKKEVVRELNDIIDSISGSPLSAYPDDILGYIVARLDDLIDDIEER